MYPPFTFSSRRSPVTSSGFMAASSQPAATLAGCMTMENGGSAADAAVAMAAVLAVVEPCSTGLGGDAFALYYDPAQSRVRALNGSGRAPATLNLDVLARMGFDAVPARHGLSITVPGACAAWCDLHDRYGRLSLLQVLGPAIRLAEQGFTVGPVTAELWARDRDLLRAAPDPGPLLPYGRTPLVGERITNPSMAYVLRAIADGGRDAFYRSPHIGGRIAEAVQEAGGVLSDQDMADHHSAWVDPLCVPFENLTICECPPNGQGLVALMALRILSRFPAAQRGKPGSDERLHLLIEALRLAFADGRRHIADPEMVPGPVDRLLSSDYAAERAARITPQRMAVAAPGDPLSGSDTVQFCAVDRDGGACSMVNSVYQNFGSGVIPRGLGFALQNRGCNFSVNPNHPNCLAPSKRPYHTIIPGMALHADGSLFGPFGVMGGFMQPQGHVQVLTHMLWDGMDPQQALDQPRFCLPGGDPSDPVALEETLSPAVGRALSNRGHETSFVAGYERSLFGRGQIIVVDRETRGLIAGSDPRADGCASGW